MESVAQLEVRIGDFAVVGIALICVRKGSGGSYGLCGSYRCSHKKKALVISLLSMDRVGYTFVGAPVDQAKVTSGKAWVRNASS